MTGTRACTLLALAQPSRRRRNMTYYQNCRQDAGVFSPTYPPETPAPAGTPLGSVQLPSGPLTDLKKDYQEAFHGQN